MCLKRLNGILGSELLAAGRGSHLCLVYRSDKERIRFVRRFIAQESVDPTNPQAHRSSLNTRQITHHRLKSEGHQRDILSSQRKVPRYSHTIVESYDSNLPNVSRITDMSEHVRQAGGTIEPILKLEGQIDSLVAQYEFVAICLYDARSLDGESLMKVMAAHPLIMAGGQIVMNTMFEPAKIGRRV